MGDNNSSSRREFIPKVLPPIPKEQPMLESIEDMNIIIVDIDGVLNSKKSLLKMREMIRNGQQDLMIARAKEDRSMSAGNPCMFDKEYVERFCAFVAETKSKVALGSSWKDDEETIETFKFHLRRFGVEDSFIGCTPERSSKSEAVKEYIESQRKLNPNCRFLVFGDNIQNEETNTKDWLAPYLVNCKFSDGLTEEDCKEGKNVLDKQKNRKEKEPSDEDPRGEH